MGLSNPTRTQKLLCGLIPLRTDSGTLCLIHILVIYSRHAVIQVRILAPFFGILEFIYGQKINTLGVVLSSTVNIFPLIIKFL
jgi:hypothetical protein